MTPAEQQRLTWVEAHLENLGNDLKEIKNIVKDLHDAQTHAKGMLAGVTKFLAGMGVIAAAGAWLYDHLGKFFK